MKPVQSALTAIYRILLTGTEFVHAGPLFALLHLASSDFWAFIVFSLLLKLGLYLNEIGIITIRSQRVKVILKAVKWLILLALWVLVSLFDVEDGHWRPIDQMLPVLLAVGVLFITGESVLYAGETVIEEHQTDELETLAGTTESESKTLQDIMHQFAQLRRVVAVVLILLVVILFLLLRQTNSLAELLSVFVRFTST